MDVGDEHDDGGDDQQEGDKDGHARHRRLLALTRELDLAHREHGVGERADEDADCELARPILQDRAHDPRRELAHRQLDHDHGDREHEGRERDHRRCDRAQDDERRVRPACHLGWQEVRPKPAVDGDGAKTEDDTGEDAQHRQEPKAGTHSVREAEAGDAPTCPVSDGGKRWRGRDSGHRRIGAPIVPEQLTSPEPPLRDQPGAENASRPIEIARTRLVAGAPSR